MAASARYNNCTFTGSAAKGILMKSKHPRDNSVPKVAGADAGSDAPASPTDHDTEYIMFCGIKVEPLLPRNGTIITNEMIDEIRSRIGC